MRQGWQYFRCDECSKHWRETSRDASSQSVSHCGDYCQPTSPYMFKLDFGLPVDKYGNLIDYMEEEVTGDPSVEP